MEFMAKQSEPKDQLSNKLINLVSIYVNLTKLKKMQVGKSSDLLVIAKILKDLKILETLDFSESSLSDLRKFKEKVILIASGKLDPMTYERWTNFCSQNSKSTKSLKTLLLFLASEIEYYQMFETGCDGISNVKQYYCGVCGRTYSTNPRRDFLFETSGNAQASNVVNNGIIPRSYAVPIGNPPTYLDSISGIGPRSSGAVHGIAPRCSAASTVTIARTTVITAAVSSVPVYTAVFATTPSTAVYAATASAPVSKFTTTATAAAVSNNAQETNARQEQVPSRKRRLSSSF